MFTPHDDPGPDFLEVLRRRGIPFLVQPAGALDAPHGTTCLALRYAEGILMAGDRRATMGHAISSRDVEKVVQTDDFSGVAFAGTASLAMEMVTLFRLQLEHFEKMEGRPLTLEGKANQLGLMVRGNMASALQGMAVVPLFAGYDQADDTGRLWSYDVLGGRYAEQEHATTGSGGAPAGAVLSVGWRRELDREGAVGLAARALWEASDVDSATGGPDLLRGIFPVMATISARGWEPVPDDEQREVFASIQDEVSRR